jgi:S-adenosylmethionine/arginine decarboxylase-like enzyme
VLQPPHFLAESGYQIHDWPELLRVTGVFYTCGTIDSKKAMLYIASKLKAIMAIGIIYDFDNDKVVEEFKSTKGDQYE